MRASRRMFRIPINGYEIRITNAPTKTEKQKQKRSLTKTSLKKYDTAT